MRVLDLGSRRPGGEASWLSLTLALSWCAVFHAPAIDAHEGAHRQIEMLTRQIEHSSEEGVKRGAEKALLYLRRGELYRFHEDWKSAAADYENARRLDPRLSAVDLCRGKLFLDMQIENQAKTCIQSFLSVQPDHVDALVTRARIHSRQSKYSAAAADYSRAIELINKERKAPPEFYLQRAKALLAAGNENISEALRGLDEGLARLGPVITLELRAIELEVERKAYEAALKRLGAISTRSARKERWLYRRGMILEKAGRSTDAERAYEHALQAIKSLRERQRKNRSVLRLQSEIVSSLARLARARTLEEASS